MVLGKTTLPLTRWVEIIAEESSSQFQWIAGDQKVNAYRVNERMKVITRTTPLLKCYPGLRVDSLPLMSFDSYFSHYLIEILIPLGLTPFTYTSLLLIKPTHRPVTVVQEICKLMHGLHLHLKMPYHLSFTFAYIFIVPFQTCPISILIKEKQRTFNFPFHLTLPPSLYEYTSDTPTIRE